LHQHFSPRSLALGGLSAAAYVALTLMFAPISFAQIQFRISEALTLLPVLSPAFVPGLFIGCLAANLVTGQPWQDVVFGSLASLVAALLTRRFRHTLWLAALMPVAINALVIGLMLYWAYGLHPYISFLAVGAGQAVVCFGLGVPLVRLLQQRQLPLA